jgi:hypothetical protein
MTPEEISKIGNAMRDMVERNMAFSNKFSETIQKIALKNQTQFLGMAHTISRANIAFAQSSIFQDFSKHSELVNSTIEILGENNRPSHEIYKKISQLNLGQFSHVNAQFSELAKNISSLALYRSPVDQELLDSLERAYQLKLKEVKETGDKSALKNLIDTVEKANEITKKIRAEESDIFVKVTKFVSKLIANKQFQDYSSDLLKNLIIQIIIMICFQSGTNQTINVKNETITINNNFDNETADIEDLKTLISKVDVNLRSRKDLKSRIIFVIPADTEVKVLREYNKWILIALTTAQGNYVIGYSYKEYFD